MAVHLPLRSSADGPEPSEPSSGQGRAVVPVLAFCGALVALMQTLVLPLLPRFPELLHSTPSTTSWMATASLVAGAVATPVLGRLGDMKGKRRMVLVSLSMLVAGSALGGVSSALAPLLVARTLQGASAGVIPLGISIIRDELPPARVGGGIALVSATMGIGGGLGLPLAGVLVGNFDWHAVFWVSAAMGLVALGLVVKVVPESPVRTPGRFDVLGAIGLMVILVCLLLSVSKGSSWGWTDAKTIGPLIIGAVVLRIWSRHERRVVSPLVDLTTTLRRPVLLTNIASVCIGFAMFASFLGTITIVQMSKASGHGFGGSLELAGLLLLPGTFVMMGLSPVSARVSAAYGPRTTVILGALFIALGYAVRIVLTTELWHVAFGAVIINCGVAFTFGALPALIMDNVPDTETAAANGFNALCRSVGTSTASAVSSAILGGITITVAGEEYASPTAFTVLYSVALVAALIAAVLARAIDSPPRGVTVPTGPVLVDPGWSVPS